MSEVCDTRRLPEPMVRLETPESLDRFLREQFLTDRYRESLDKGRGLVRTWVDNVTKQGPVWFKDMVDPTVEYHGYTTLWRIITLRRCYRPLRADQYIFHELVHVGSFDYDSARPIEEKFRDNELTAGMVSNAMIYFEFPGLREKNPKTSIWVDKLLTDRISLVPGISNKYLYDSDRGLFEVKLLELRRKCASLNDEHRYRSIYQDSLVADELAPIYSPIFNEVKHHTAQLMQDSKVNAQEACERHEQWLVENTKPRDICPFQSTISEFQARLPQVLQAVKMQFK